MTGRVFVLSGDQSAILRCLSEAENCPRPEVAGFDEKAITRFRYVRSLMRERKTDLLVFATKALALQRFQVVFAFYLLLGHSRRRLIMDEEGHLLSVTWPRFIGFVLPRFLFEALASAVILLLTVCRLLFLSMSIRQGENR
jgi:hypothetical protein